MFTIVDRDRALGCLLARVETDGAITGAALTGSLATGDGDRWSDIDLVLAVRGELIPVLNKWTRSLYQELGAQHHWDLTAGPPVIRVFLLPGWLEIDLKFAPEDQFGARGPQWRTIFGQPQPLEPFPPPDPRQLTGLIWHHTLHAYICIERGRWWQAEYWISAMRDHVITLACLRLGHPADHAKGAHLLPENLTEPLDATLVRSPREPELRRALAATINVVTGELERADPALAARLRPMLTELAGSAHGPDLPAR
jgi:Nucleotidyltransferase domain